MFEVMMVFEFGEYSYGKYENRDRANEIAMIVRAERGCETYVQEVKK